MPEQELPFQDPLPILPASCPTPFALALPWLTVTRIRPVGPTFPSMVNAASPALLSILLRYNTVDATIRQRSSFSGKQRTRCRDALNQSAGLSKRDFAKRPSKIILRQADSIGRTQQFNVFNFWQVRVAELEEDVCF